MKTLSVALRRRIEQEEISWLVRNIQQSEFVMLAEQSAEKRRVRLEILGAILLGFFISAVAIISNYLIFVRMLHVSF
ncbi:MULTISPECIES: hypothetical protein [Methylomonas]|uniref:hypothetical protein n=1 Tax=Methylomonas TaxID=416 RepID=UPI0012326D76|nr:hypothetical protein [Methylomonas rhizoryzae]